MEYDDLLSNKEFDKWLFKNNLINFKEQFYINKIYTLYKISLLDLNDLKNIFPSLSYDKYIDLNIKIKRIDSFKKLSLNDRIKYFKDNKAAEITTIYSKNGFKNSINTTLIKIFFIINIALKIKK